jgi:hypothetical protein
VGEVGVPGPHRARFDAEPAQSRAVGSGIPAAHDSAHQLSARASAQLTASARCVIGATRCPVTQPTAASCPNP